MKKEKEIVRVVFEFKDGTTKILEDKELKEWKTFCMLCSDYLLPDR